MSAVIKSTKSWFIALCTLLDSVRRQGVYSIPLIWSNKYHLHRTPVSLYKERVFSSKLARAAVPTGISHNRGSIYQEKKPIRSQEINSISPTPTFSPVKLLSLILNDLWPLLFYVCHKRLCRSMPYNAGEANDMLGLTWTQGLLDLPWGHLHSAPSHTREV